MTRFGRRASPSATPEEVAEFEATLKNPRRLPPSIGKPPRCPGQEKPMAFREPEPSRRPHSGIDRSTRQKLRRGRIAPTRTLDLHGYRVAKARQIVCDFVLDSLAGGHRCVRVVTGRKLGEAGPTGALREALPEIVRDPPLRDVVLGLEPAPNRHGGDGAFHLLIRTRPVR